MLYDENTHTAGQLDMSLLFVCETIYGCLMTPHEFCKSQQFLRLERVIREPHDVLYLLPHTCGTGTVTDSPMLVSDDGKTLICMSRSYINSVVPQYLTCHKIYGRYFLFTMG
jgi:hypothetical protein